jgi:N-acetylneuraminate synthase
VDGTLINRQNATVNPSSVQIGKRPVGPGEPCFIIGEIGINHNGDLAIAKKLIDVAAIAGCDAVKFQKRTVEVVYTEEDLARPRENPFGSTNGDLKRGLEFGLDEYRAIDIYCKERKIAWLASCWDEESVDFIDLFNPPCYKIASACLTDDNLLRHHKTKGRPIVLSTGMSTIEEIDHAVETVGKDNLVLLHTTSTYPAKLEELNLLVILGLAKRYNVPIGYSGHEVGLSPSLAAVVLGACIVERHITLDRAMWGSDQPASIEPQGLERLVRDIRAWELSKGNGVKCVYASEIPVRKKLRRKG